MVEPAKPATKRRRPPASPVQPARRDELAGPPASRLKTAGWRIAEAGAAIAAFLLSLGVFLLGGLQSLRGPEIVVLPPDHVILFRDAPSETADSLVVAAEVGLINTAGPSYGDVPVRVRADFGETGDAQFRYEASVHPVYLSRDEVRDPAACPVQARCIVPVGLNRPPDAPIPNTRLLVVAEQRELLSVPGGSSRSAWLSFAMSDCEGVAEACARYAGFDEAVEALRATPTFTLRITLEFHGDGRKTVICEPEIAGPGQREAFFDFLEERGWASFRCRRE